MNQNTDNGAKALIQRIEETAFFTHYSMLGDGNVRQYDWEKVGAKLTGLEKRLWDFLLLSHPLAPKEAAALLGKPALDFLLRHKLCTKSKGKLSLGLFKLVRYWGMSFFIERPSAATFIGDDTKALLAFLPRRTGGRCLSLFSAGGLEIMPLAASNTELDFVGIKASEGVLRANLELNAAELAPHWQFPSKSSSDYDLIVSNPPYLFEPSGVTMPKYAAGGPDGLKCVRTFLKTASTKLKPDGLAISSFAFFAEVDAQLMEQRLRAFLAPYELNYVITVSSKLLMEPGVPVFNQVISMAVSGSAQTPNMEVLVKKTMDCIKRKKFGAAHLLKGRFWKGAKGEAVEQQITNYSDSYYGTWII
jgi:hypothetical protein